MIKIKNSAVENGLVKEQARPITTKQTSNGSNEDHSPQKADSGHRAGEDSIVYEHEADAEVLMPKLRRSDYCTLPRMPEPVAKERAEPGFCCHVEDFMLGRQGYGSIRFLGETDVRGQALESLVQFNTRGVIAYMDNSTKPPVGQGLNKLAENVLQPFQFLIQRFLQAHLTKASVTNHSENSAHQTYSCRYLYLSAIVQFQARRNLMLERVLSSILWI